MRFLVKPSELRGWVLANNSKASSIRNIIIASQLDKKTKIKNVNFCDDVSYLILSLKAAGIGFLRKKNDLIITKGNNFINNNVIFNAGESGAVLRFLIPLFLLYFKKFKIKAKKELIKRPLNEYQEIFKENNFTYNIENDIITFTRNDIKLKNEYEIDLKRSSQFASGIALLAPSIKTIKIKLVNNKYHLSYFLYTLSILDEFGAEIISSNNQYEISFNKPRINKVKIETDFSNLIYWLIMSYKNDVRVRFSKRKSKEPDYNLFNMFYNLGYFVSKNKLQKYSDKDFNLDFKNNLDLVFPFLVLAVAENKKGKFLNLKNLAYKESNRKEAVFDFLKRCKVPFSYLEDNLTFDAREYNKKNNLIFDAKNDHRLIMSYIVFANLIDSEIEIRNVGSLSKSSPDFLKKYINLGGVIIWKKN